MFDIQEFGERLKYLRQEKEWTLQEMADRCDLSKTYLWQLEHGRNEPSFRIAMRLAALFNVSMEWLGTGIQSTIRQV